MWERRQRGSAGIWCLGRGGAGGNQSHDLGSQAGCSSCHVLEWDLQSQLTPTLSESHLLTAALAVLCFGKCLALPGVGWAAKLIPSPASNLVLCLQLISQQ